MAIASGFDSVVDDTNWRIKVRKPNSVKFDDVAKLRWLTIYAQTNNKTRACKACGITYGCYQHHIRRDPEFKEAVRAASQDYRDMVAEEVLRRGVKGWKEPVFAQGRRAMDVVIDPITQLPKIDEHGNFVMGPASIVKFDSQLLQMEAKRVDHSYRERGVEGGDEDVGGVLVAPAAKTPEEFIKEQMAKGERIQSPEDIV